MLPPYIKEQIDEYVNRGVPLGGFLYAVMTNDLFRAFVRADEVIRVNLFDICDYIYYNTPVDCWGTAKKVREWLEIHRRRSGII